MVIAVLSENKLLEVLSRALVVVESTEEPAPPPMPNSLFKLELAWADDVSGLYLSSARYGSNWLWVSLVCSRTNGVPACPVTKTSRAKVRSRIVFFMVNYLKE